MPSHSALCPEHLWLALIHKDRHARHLLLELPSVVSTLAVLLLTTFGRKKERLCIFEVVH